MYLPQTHQRKEKEAFAFFSFFDEEAKTIMAVIALCKFGYFKSHVYRCILAHGNACDYETACERTCECPNWQDHMDSEKLEVFV